MPDIQKKSVALLGSAYPLRGGIAAYNERIAREFIKNDFETKIFNFSMQYPGILFPGKTQYSSEPPPDGITIDTCINSVNPLNWWINGKKIKKANYDLLIIKYWLPFMAPCLGSIARIVKKNGHTKVISIVDNIIPHEKKPVDKILSSYFVNSVDGFVVMSDSVMKDMLLFDDKKPRIFCPHPLYDSFGPMIPKQEAKKRLNLDENFNYILFFGFIRDYKGLDILLEAFADGRFREKPLKLLVAGEFYTDSKPYFDIIEKHHLQENVIISNDFIPDSKVGEYFCAVDLVVQPYKDATQSGVTQIAYHFHKPMVVTNVGGLAEIVPDNKVGYVTEANSGAVADAIARFYDENKEEEFTDNAAIEKNKYSWQNMIDSILNVSGLKK